MIWMEKEELISALREMVGQLEKPPLKEKFRDFNQDVQFRFPDMDFSCIVKFRSGEATVEERSVSSPNIDITADSKTMSSILSGEKDPTSAYMSGKLKAEGPMKDLLKLQTIMKES